MMLDTNFGWNAYPSLIGRLMQLQLSTLHWYILL